MTNLSSKLETWLKGLAAETVTELFIWATLAVLVLALVEAMRGRHSRFLEFAPTLMTSLGILGTFVGIVVGLLHFESEHIAESIPKLLTGLKTAFITSIVGMAAAMFFNALDAWVFAPRRDRNGVLPEITPKDIHQVMSSQLAAIEKLNQGIAGSEEGSLVGQVKFLRQDVSHFQKQHEVKQAEFTDRLWRELESFAEMLSKSATATIIEALEQVIRDFNNNLTEQFGENFKRLDESVKKLVDWQIEYKEQIEKMAAQYQQSVDSLLETRTAVAGIWEECKEIPLAMAELKEVLTVNHHQVNELRRHLEAFILMRDKAVTAVPTIQAKLDEVGNQLTASVTMMSTAVEDITGKLANSSVAVQERLEKVGEDLLKGSQEMKVAMQEGAEHFKDSITTTQGAFRDMSSSVLSTNERLAETLDDTSKELAADSRGILDRMQTAAQVIQKHIDDAAGKMTEANAQLVQRFGRTADEFEQAHRGILDQVREKSESMQKLVSDRIEVALNNVGRSVNDTVTALDEHLKSAVSRTGSTISKELEQLEQATAREIETAIEAMGKSLTQITGRFVTDYDQMVKRMDEVIRNTGTDPGAGRS